MFLVLLSFIRTVLSICIQTRQSRCAKSLNSTAPTVEDRIDRNQREFRGVLGFVFNKDGYIDSRESGEKLCRQKVTGEYKWGIWGGGWVVEGIFCYGRGMEKKMRTGMRFERKRRGIFLGGFGKGLGDGIEFLVDGTLEAYDMR